MSYLTSPALQIRLTWLQESITWDDVPTPLTPPDLTDVSPPDLTASMATRAVGTHPRPAGTSRVGTRVDTRVGTAR